MSSLIKQNSWVAGEINPNLIEASNNEYYFASALKIENMYISKSQTLKRIPATKNLTYDDGLHQNFKNQLNLKYNGVNYIVIVADKFHIYTYDDSNNTLNYLFSIGDSDDINFTDYVTINNTIIFCYNQKYPKILYVDNTPPESVDSSFGDFVFLIQPTLDFNNFSYYDWDFDITSNSLTSSVLISSSNSNINVYDFVNDNFLNGTFTSIGIENGSATGSMRITEITNNEDNTVTVSGNTIYQMDESIYKGEAVVLQQPIFYIEEEAPKIVGYFDGRLYFGNTKSNPMLLAGSQLTSINNFDVGSGLSGEAIVYFINDTNSSELKYIVGHVGLFLHTDKNEHVVVPSTDYGITPSSFIVQKLSDYGAYEVKPIVYNNFLLFVDKTGNKVLRILSPSAGNFQTDEITKGMDIQKNIDILGVIDDELIDLKLLCFGSINDNKLNAVVTNGNVFGKTTLKLLPDESLVQRYYFCNVGKKTIMFVNNQNNTMRTLLFDNKLVGVSSYQTYGSGISYVAISDSYQYKNDSYFFIKQGERITTSEVSIIGNANPIYIQSMPLTYQSTDTWSVKSISFIYVSCYNSARFKVNNQNVAYPSLNNITSTDITLKTGNFKVPTFNKSFDDYQHIEIKSKEPYNVEITAYGFNIETNIIG